MGSQEDQASDLEFITGESGIDYPPPDDLFEALTNSTRRRLLAALPPESSVTLDELTDILAGDQTASPDEWAKVQIELVHAHLPLLAEAGLVTYEDEEITRAAYPEPVGELMTFAGEYEAAIVETDPRR
ncbi:winged helix-turn-helix domain-containing protein [Haloarcula sediminis]|uniref:winged helix-turn-helix domain-containing protein n=1 Tax=Haloarcula sediminis TaxID=3111777 RepID=UPI002D7658D2|nr:helix-turn-helix domain-containing protein [Haloarcula sp. CK38]